MYLPLFTVVWATKSLLLIQQSSRKDILFPNFLDYYMLLQTDLKFSFTQRLLKEYTQEHAQ